MCTLGMAGQEDRLPGRQPEEDRAGITVVACLQRNSLSIDYLDHFNINGIHFLNIIFGNLVFTLDHDVHMNILQCLH